MFKVVPICEKQRRDINPKHILCDGLYRTCDVYKGGGGYDAFPNICKKRIKDVNPVQFVVQLYGCPFRCSYCYVTPDGITGGYKLVSSEDMLTAYEDSGCEVFHLMGGAPALYMKDWKEIITKVKLFHSDFLLVEGEYDEEVLETINKKNCLYAVSIKGSTPEEYETVTGVKVDFDLLKRNLHRLINANVNFYITFTGMTIDSVNAFKATMNLEESCYEDSFIINLVNYEALK